ncbi:MAG: sulfotransferase family protein [Rhodobacteraceae bacterium]|nr:sulfotransferase family protein [Paracoccaceae bacterium]
MPLCRIGTKLIYFCHIPKCGGTAVGKYLENRFRPLAFLDPQFYSIDAEYRWTKSSPQHIPDQELSRLFPAGFFDASFAMVRHPVDRLASVYLYQHLLEKRITKGIKFENWLESLADQKSANPYIYDNHIRPMIDFVPKNAKIFRLENGMAAVVDWLDHQAGDASGPRQIPPANVLANRLAHAKQAKIEFTVSPTARELIVDIYKVDFERFGYDPAAPTRY